MIHPSFRFVAVSHNGLYDRSIISLDKLKGWERARQPFPFDCHLSLYRFTEEYPKYWAENTVRGKDGKYRRSTSGYSGMFYGDYLPLEIDGDNLEESGKIAENILHRLAEHGYRRETFSVYYSGSRGYHIMFPLRNIADFAPRKDFNAIMFEVLLGLFPDMVTEKENGGYESKELDLQVFAFQHMMRMPNSIHPKTNLYKTAIPDYISLTDTESVQRYAASANPHARPTASPETYIAARIAQEIKERIDANELRTPFVFSEVKQVTRVPARKTNMPPGHATVLAARKNYEEILRGGMEDGEVRGGAMGRRNAMMSLTGMFKQMGFNKRMARIMVDHWNESNKPPLETKKIDEVFRSFFRL